MAECLPDCHRVLLHWRSGAVTESCSCCEQRYRLLYGEQDSSIVRSEHRRHERGRAYDPGSGEWLPVEPFISLRCAR